MLKLFTILLEYLITLRVNPFFEGANNASQIALGLRYFTVRNASMGLRWRTGNKRIAY